MKIYKFEEKLPELGSNIVVIHESSEDRIIRIGICEFTLEVRKSVLEKEDWPYHPQDYYSDDPSENCEYDIRCSDYWFYPSSIKLPKKKEFSK